MKGFNLMIRRFCLSLALVCAVSVSAVVATLAPANAGSNAIIEMTIGKVGFLVGVSRGDGRLFYNGRQADLDINGLRVGARMGDPGRATDQVIRLTMALMQSPEYDT